MLSLYLPSVLSIVPICSLSCSKNLLSIFPAVHFSFLYFAHFLGTLILFLSSGERFLRIFIASSLFPFSFSKIFSFGYSDTAYSSLKSFSRERYHKSQLAI